MNTAKARSKLLEYSQPEPNSGCWLWLKSIGNHGYGNFCQDKQIMTAPRASYRAFKCENIMTHEYVLHKCDNRLCVNPEHLELGTAAENARQAAERGRVRNQSKRLMLSFAEMKEIRADTRTHRDIARAYGTYPSTVFKIKHGKYRGWAA